MFTSRIFGGIFGLFLILVSSDHVPSDPHEDGVEKQRVEKHRVCRHIIEW
jgi:hypothetical protein